MIFCLGFRFSLNDSETFEKCKDWCNSETNYYIDEVNGMYEVLAQPEESIKDKLEHEKRTIEAWFKKHDYIGIKIATGRATIEEYETEVSEMKVKANRLNEIKAELETL